jgi:oligoribonuclease
MSLLIALDFETTGLDPRAGAEPIELAVVVLDDSFRELASAEWLIRPEHWEGWDSETRRMHTTSGLAALAREHGQLREVVDDQLPGLLLPFLDGSPLHLLGNSVHFDRDFLRHYFPDVERMLHHRHLDVSSVRMLAERVTKAEPLPGEKPHRAMADVRRSIAELKYWTRQIAYLDLQYTDSLPWDSQP